MEKLSGNHKCLTSFPKDVMGTQTLQAPQHDAWSCMQVCASSTQSCDSGAEISGQCSMLI